MTAYQASYVLTPYIRQIRKTLFYGEHFPDRTGTGRRSVFGMSQTYDLNLGFPILQERRIFFHRNVIPELAWMASGKTCISELKAICPDCKIWDPWKPEYSDDLGPIYGAQWRRADGYIDQLTRAIELIHDDPCSRRILVDSWQVADMDTMALPPCHFAFQFHPNPEKKWMDLTIYQRSCDLIVGVPYNLAFYALLLYGICEITGYKPRYLHHHMGDCHIYENHLKAAREIVNRYFDLARGVGHSRVSVEIEDRANIYYLDDFIDRLVNGRVKLKNYRPLEHIKLPIAV